MKRLLLLITLTLTLAAALTATASATTWTEYGTFRCNWTNDYAWHFSPTAATLNQFAYYRFIGGAFNSASYWDWQAHYWTGPAAGYHVNDVIVYCHV